MAAAAGGGSCHPLRRTAAAAAAVCSTEATAFTCTTLRLRAALCRQPGGRGGVRGLGGGPAPGTAIRRPNSPPTHGLKGGLQGRGRLLRDGRALHVCKVF